MSRNLEREEEIVIDWRHLFKTLLKKFWVLLITGVVFATSAFVYTRFFVTPKYSSSVMLAVNNKSISLGGGEQINISAADLSASQSLIDTYIAILDNRTTMEMIIEKAELEYTPNQVIQMISAREIEETEVFTITVTTEDPYEAAHIANTILEVLPQRVSEVLDGSSVRVVDDAIVNLNPVSPNIPLTVIQAFLVGVLLSAVIVVFIALFDDTIHSDDYLLENYDLPVLARVPDFHLGMKGGRYGNNAYYGKKGGR